MVHVPIPVNVTVISSTVHTDAVKVANVTFNPEDDVASSTVVASENAAFAGVVKVIVWPPDATVNVLVTGVALLLLVLPVWRALTLQVPAVSIVTVQVRLPIAPELATVQTAVVFDTKVTSSPDVEVALTVNGASPSVLLARTPNVITCVALAIETE
jgi:hypothetical protein